MPYEHTLVKLIKHIYTHVQVDVDRYIININ